MIPSRQSGSPSLDDPSERPSGKPRTAEILGPAFKSFVWNSYDHIGLLVLANLVWIALCLPLITAPAATAGLFHLARKAAGGEDATLSDFFAGFRRFFLPALRVGAFDLAAVLVLWVNIDFYGHMGGPASIPGMVLAGAMIWLAAFLLLMHAHMFPLLVAGETGFRRLLRKSALLTLDNFAFSIGITLQALSVAVLCVVTGAGLVLALGSLTAVLLSTGHRELLKKYFPDSQAAQEPPETRTWRDLWRPWESGTHRE